MLRGLWPLAWIEFKVFLREPLGAIGTIVVPVLVFILLGRATAGRPLPASGAALGVLSRGRRSHAGVAVHHHQHRRVAGDDHLDLP